MNEQQLIAKGYYQLGEYEKIKEGDYMEWESNSFSLVRRHSLLVGRPTANLKPIQLALTSRPAKAFRLLKQA